MFFTCKSTRRQSGRFRDVVSKVVWVGRTASMVFGLALVLAPVLGIATMALAAVPGDPFKLAQVNHINALTTLIGSSSGSMLAVDNDSTATGARALDLRVDDGNAPMRVNATAGKATNLNADLLDGMEAGALAEPRGYAHVEIDGGIDTDYPSEGVNGVVVPTDDFSLYCFDLTFTLKAAVGATHINNSGWSRRRRRPPTRSATLFPVAAKPRIGTRRCAPTDLIPGRVPR